ncbi:hypothetical protein [Sorangium sp. So ce887]|uniref:hypothetical protein n=1 Tax=Sorangium sp. So ce887 TaxID=3133324 RepID=UPI003F62C3B1
MEIEELRLEEEQIELASATGGFFRKGDYDLAKDGPPPQHPPGERDRDANDPLPVKHSQESKK